MQISESELAEFFTEASEMLHRLEELLLRLEAGARFHESYAEMFRILHSLKGASGMIEFTQVEKHFHELESHLIGYKGQSTLPQNEVDRFLKGVDTARNLFRAHGSKEPAPALSCPVNPDQPGAPPPTSPPTSGPSQTTAKVTPLHPRSTAAQVGNLPFSPLILNETPRVLVLDDEPGQLESMLEYLASKDMAAESAHSVDGVGQIMRRVQEFNPHVVVTDVQMPKLTGYEVLSAIREVNPHLPIILISGHFQKDELIQATQLGVFSAFGKPFDPQELHDSCWKAYNQYQLGRLARQSVDLLLYQFPELTQFLEATGKHEIREVIQTEVKSIIRQLRVINGKSGTRSSNVG